ncbi:HAD-like domain-containing protein [Lipomyces tetrasporus]|uniref:HAD-like domain-containing protein n=1 Tax=Lipomyces tetrasporus TaxID=54092 RepID=A0AAD7QUT4_9ASCO|nr:HAD-like domain-containing protein [Lipomyces tetrasporus]KAJ8101885.1 HAD-like domain-containing protein [Lipomyces tetrasporus]
MRAQTTPGSSVLTRHKTRHGRSHVSPPPPHRHLRHPPTHLLHTLRPSSRGYIRACSHIVCVFQHNPIVLEFSCIFLRAEEISSSPLRQALPDLTIKQYKVQLFLAMTEIKALLFDVFGTVVDWRTSVKEQILNCSPDSIQTTVNWDEFMQDWRNVYFKFASDNSKDDAKSVFNSFLSVDQLYRQALDVLAEKYGINDVWTEQQKDEIAAAWHYLKGWDDSVEGLTLLKSKFIIGSLSNGNMRLLVDMAKYAGLPWDVVFSSELFKIYKPSARVYLGATDYLQLKPENVLMVAAHMYDLEAAKKCGLRTAYVVRKGEDIGITVSPDDVDYFVSDFIELYKQLTME